MLKKYFIQCLTTLCFTLCSLSSIAATVHFDLTNPDTLPGTLLTDSLTYTNNQYGVSVTATAWYTDRSIREAQQSQLYFDTNYGLGEKHGDESHPDRYSLDGYGIPGSVPRYHADSDFIRLEFNQSVNLQSYSLGLIDSDSDSDAHVFFNNTNDDPVRINPISTLNSSLGDNVLAGPGSDAFSNVWYISSFNSFHNIFGDVQVESFLLDSVTVTAVPIPGAMILFMSAIAGLFGIGRFKRTNKQGRLSAC